LQKYNIKLSSRDKNNLKLRIFKLGATLRLVFNYKKMESNLTLLIGDTTSTEGSVGDIAYHGSEINYSAERKSYDYLLQ